MKHILLPVDFSDASSKAVDYGVMLYGLEDVHYHLFYTLAIPVTASEMSYLPIDKYEHEASAKVAEEMTRISEKYPGINVNSITEHGDIALAILNKVKENEKQVIVMGTHGAEGFKELMYGSNAYRVVDEVKEPVWVVPANSKFRPPKNIVFTSDLKPYKNPYALDEFIAIARKFDSKVTILNFKEKSDSFSLNAQLNYFDELFDGIEMSMVFDDSDGAVEGLHNYLRDHPADLVVAVKRKKNFFENLFSRSVTKSMTFHLNFPMLILHD